MTSDGRTRKGMVRSHAATAGRAVPSRNTVDEASLLTPNPELPHTGLGAQAGRVMGLCTGGKLSVAEVGFYLELPAAVVKVIVSELVDSGHLAAQAPVRIAETDRSLLEAVLSGLRKL
ncbi:DUF742 domain-containing protein [Streptomyces sp. NPDC048638]|uniref:DUF742 domain-containing protein n=1 Tax=Streptomyces sp. NPDC048638 TaxID=3365580 RepID=UPI00371A38BB